MNNKLDTASIKVNLWNSKAEERKPYVLKYWQVIKQLQNTKINYATQVETLVNAGLATQNRYCSAGWDWDYKLKELDKQLRIKI